MLKPACNATYRSNPMLTALRLSLFLVLWLPGIAMASLLTLDDDNDQLEVHQQADYFEDKTGKLIIDDISDSAFSDHFTPLANKAPNFGRNQSTHWIRFNVNKQSTVTWYLVINSVILAEHELFIMPVKKPQSNNAVKYAASIQHRVPTYRLNLHAATTYTVYLRLSNKGKSILFAPIQLLNSDALHKKTNKETLFFASMVIGIITMAIYNLLLFFRLKDKNYLTLSLTLVAITFILQRINNTLPLPAKINNPESPLFYIVFFFFMIASITLMRNLLNTKDKEPVIDKFLSFLLVFIFLCAPIANFIPRADLLSFATGTLIIACALTLMIKRQFEGNPIVKVFFAATSVFTIGSLPIVAWGLNLLESFNVASNIFHVSTFCSAIMMSLALAEKTRQMKLQTDQARAANKAKTEFLTTMSHELRTPMHAVMGVGSLMKLTPLSNQQQNYVEKLDMSSNHMMSIIEQVLDLSRLEDKTVKLEKYPFQLEEVIKRVEKLLIDLAQQKGLTLQLDSDYPVKQDLEGDPTRLAQILINLLSNAIKFTEKGHVRLKIKPLKTRNISYAALAFIVSDTGPGLSQKQQERIFQPFSQIDSSHSRRSSGFGLGLAISHRLVSNMGGTLKVESEPGKGSRFFFTIKLREIIAKKPAIIDPANFRNVLEGLRILLVDDDEINRFLGLELLQVMAANVSTADSGATALTLLQTNHYDLVLLDISMPDMDGYETTRRIRANGNDKLPVIALTAHAISGERDRCLKAGMNDYLAKPFATQDLLAMIQFWTAAKTAELN